MGVSIDLQVEQEALRGAGLLGRGEGMGNALYAIDFAHLPPEAVHTIHLIANGGPFPHREDGTAFGNRFGDLPSNGEYREYTVATPGLSHRGARRIVARKNGVLFFTACHYERVQGQMSVADRVVATAAVDEMWRNGFYVITGMPASLRAALRSAMDRP